MVSWQVLLAGAKCAKAEEVRPNMYILGVSGCPECHDGSAAILRDNEIVAMAEQERFSRRRHAHGEWPLDAIRFCLQQAGITLENVAIIAYPWNTVLPAAVSIDTFDPQTEMLDLGPMLRSLGMSEDTCPPIHRVSHHVAHFESAYWLSGYPEAAGLVVDGRGETEATSLFFGQRAKHVVLKQYPLIHSLGLLYDAAAECSGLGGDDAGKFMGLAAYGRPTRRVPLDIDVGEGYRLWTPESLSEDLDDAWLQQYWFLRRYMAESNYPYVDASHESIMDYADLACSVQTAVQDALLQVARLLRADTKCPRLVISGGVGLNCSANAYLARESGFAEVFVTPLANDCGIALGAALDAARHMALLDRGLAQAPLRHVYWGPDYDADAISEAVAQSGLSTQILPGNGRAKSVAEALARGSIVAWFKGRAEVGPRALGARSVIASPASRRMLYRINRLKGREAWRPLAPSVLAECYDEYFVDAPPSRFMLMTAVVREHQRAHIPAVVHVDGTSRPQIVEPDTAPEYSEVIREFRALTGLPMVVNTSFNLAGQPMVCTPRQAVESFQSADIDLLVLGDYVLAKVASVV